jgi:hypothetical protein
MVKEAMNVRIFSEVTIKEGSSIFLNKRYDQIWSIF